MKAKDYVKLMDKKISYKRSSVRIKSTQNTVSVEVNAQDPVALVASLGSVLKQIRIIGNAESLFD
ncbi:MAG: hypothetical protein KGH49_00040 [Candidatus Micrarchaeota archaeon]|nr:hypothetical protein [Candidatus Micrarchaeota archaeon]